MSVLRFARAVLTGGLIAYANLALGADHVVRMLNIDPDNPDRQMVFDPALLVIAPGDTVTFVAVDKGHNTAIKRGMLPDGAEPWNGAIDEEISVTLTVPGTYGYVCLPHLEMGMVGLILVGDFAGNFEAARNVRQIGNARKVFRELFLAAEAHRDHKP
ncbi:MAG: pseudoazurin [Pseudomonadota bacterium]